MNTNKPEGKAERPTVQDPKDYAIKLAQKEVPSYGKAEQAEGESAKLRAPTEDELMKEAEEYAGKIFKFDWEDKEYRIAAASYLAAARKYSRLEGKP